MNIQILELVQCIYESQPISPTRIAELMGISTRTMRNRVDQANAMLSHIARISLSRGTGYEISVIDMPAFQALFSNNKNAEGPIPESPRDRSRFIARKLLEIDEWTPADNLADQLFVSHRTISYDLKEVAAILSGYGLRLESRPYAGIRVIGSEAERRACLAGIIIEQYPRGCTRDFTALVERIQSFISRIIDTPKRHLSSMACRNLAVDLIIMAQRLQVGSALQEQQSINPCEDQELLKLATAIGNELSTIMGITIPPQEFDSIALHLSAWQTERRSPGADDGEIWTIVSNMLERIWRVYRCDLRDDLELKMNLARHIEPLILRLKHNLSSPNPLLREIKNKYPLSYHLALEAALTLNESLGVSTSEDEIGFLSLAFALALQRRESNAPRRNIVIACASGVGSARLLEARFKDEYGRYLDQVISCDVSHLGEIDYSQINCVFTTVPIDDVAMIPVPVHLIGPLAFDPHAVKRHLLATPITSAYIFEAFDRQLLLPHVSGLGKEELIRRLCNLMKEHAVLDENFESLVLAREMAAPTAFGNNVAMPHPLQIAGESTVIAVALLDKPLDWGVDQKVEAVFLVSIGRDLDEVPDSFYRTLVRLFTNPNSIDRLIRQQTFECLLEELSTAQFNRAEV